MKFTTLSDIFPFGKYKGKSLEYVLREDRAYLDWCVQNIKDFAISEKILNEQKNSETKNDVIIKKHHFIPDKSFWPLIHDIINCKIGLDLFVEITEKHFANEPAHPSGMGLMELDLYVAMCNKWNREKIILEKQIEDRKNNISHLKEIVKKMIQTNSVVQEDGSFNISHHGGTDSVDLKLKKIDILESSNDANGNNYIIVFKYEDQGSENYEFIF